MRVAAKEQVDAVRKAEHRRLQEQDDDTLTRTKYLWLFSAENLPKNHSMMLTIPVVMYGLFRYLFLVREGEVGATPEELETFERAAERRYRKMKRRGNLVSRTPEQLKKMIEETTRH